MLNRRNLFGASAAVAAVAVVPMIAHARQASRLEQIATHQAALLALLEEEFPEGTTRLSVALGADLTTGHSYIMANGLRKRWSDDTSYTGRGCWVEDSVGDWTPKMGLIDWSAN